MTVCDMCWGLPLWTCLQEKRLRNRQTESEESLQKRMKTATEELKYGESDIVMSKMVIAV